MPLHLVPEDKEILSADLQKSVEDYYLGGRMHPETYTKVCRTIDTELNNLKPSTKSRLVWTNFGSLIGHGSSAPHKDLQHLWDKCESLFGQDKALKKFLGTLVMWRISIRDDIWLVYREKMRIKNPVTGEYTDAIDPETGKPIKRCEYWIDNNYVDPNKLPTIDDLAAKFNKRPKKSV